MASSWTAMRTYFYVTFWGWGKLHEVFSHIYSFLLTGSKCALCFGYGGYDCITQVCSYIQDFCSRISFRDYTAEFNNTLAAMLHVAQCADETLCKRLHRLYSRNEHVFVMCCSGNMCNRVLACIQNKDIGESWGLDLSRFFIANRWDSRRYSIWGVDT